MSKNNTKIKTIDSEYYIDVYYDNEYKYMSELIMGKDEAGLINDVINDLHIGPITIMHVDDWLVNHPNNYLTIEYFVPFIIDSVINEDDYSDISGVIFQLEGKIREGDYYRLLDAMANSNNGKSYIGDVILRANINTEEMITKYHQYFNMKQITDSWCGWKNLRNMLFTYVIHSNEVNLFMDTINGINSYERHFYDWTLQEVYNNSGVFNELRLGVVL